MRKKPRSVNESILTRDYLADIGTEGLCIAVMTGIAFLTGYRGGGAVPASTMAFATLCMSRLIHGFNCKSPRPVVFSPSLCNNSYLIGAFLIGMALITCVLLLPALQGIFKVVTLDMGQLAAVFGLSFLNLPVIQLMKWRKVRRSAM